MTLRRFFVAAVFAMSQVATAQVSPPVRRFVHLAISPDGRRVAWIGPPSRARTSAVNSVVLADASPAGLTNIVPLPSGDPGSAAELAWSPDGRQVAILATTNSGTPALYVVGAAGGTASRFPRSARRTTPHV